MSERVGLFGGCFSPVHNGHLAVARAAIAHLALDRLVFIPSGTPPLRQDARLMDGRERLALLELAIVGEPRMAASDSEIARSGPSYTVDTVREIAATLAARSELFFILGSDCLSRLPRWKGIDELHQRLRFAIAQRPGAEQPLGDPRLLALPVPPLPVSSTMVRERLATGAAIGDLVPAAVAARLEALPHPAGVPA